MNKMNEVKVNNFENGTIRDFIHNIHRFYT
jgi:hypothetical protein